MARETKVMLAIKSIGNEVATEGAGGIGSARSDVPLAQRNGGFVPSQSALGGDARLERPDFFIGAFFGLLLMTPFWAFVFWWAGLLG